jgi:hypothetical protein
MQTAIVAKFDHYLENHLPTNWECRDQIPIDAEMQRVSYGEWIVQLSACTHVSPV